MPSLLGGLEVDASGGTSSEGGVCVALLAVSVSTVASGLGEPVNGSLEGGVCVALLAVSAVASEGFAVVEFWREPPD